MLDTAAGGNGLAETIDIVIIDQAGGSDQANFQTDYWIFEGDLLPTENVPLPWLALLGMGAGLLGIGVWQRKRFVVQE